MTISNLVMIVALVIGAGTVQSNESMTTTSTESITTTCAEGRTCKIATNCWINGVWYNPCPSDPQPPPPEPEDTPGPQILLPN